MEIELAEREAEELCYPRDLLRPLSSTRFGDEILFMNSKVEDAVDFNEGDRELSLGLSLGGCFAMNPRETRLLRSSSTAMVSVFPNEVDFTLSLAPLGRACSLPVEAEEEHLKRKEMQGLKRMEAKRKRLEKRRQPVEVGSGDTKEDGWIGETNDSILLRWDMGSRGSEAEVEMAQLEAMRRRISVFNGRGLQGSKASNLSSSSAVPSIPGTIQRTVSAPQLPPLLRSLKSLQEDDEVLNRMTGNLNGSKATGRSIMANMPCVSTKCGGLNGRAIEGFLYKYAKGEVRIVCVCHGSFHSPAEFIKHAGGGDVENPLRHIVVSPSPH